MANLPTAVFSQVRTTFSAVILAAFAFVTALAWNSAFQSFFEKHIRLQNLGPWIYAVLVTGISVLTALALNRR